MIKIIIGIIFIIGGLTGHLELIGTQSGTALAVLGAVMVVWGIVRLVRQKQGGSNNNTPNTPTS